MTPAAGALKKKKKKKKKIVYLDTILPMGNKIATATLTHLVRAPARRMPSSG